jgi:hypothetical protein
MRLSHGFVRGETLACIYHGWRYGIEGGCSHIPAHPSLEPPKTITARVFACHEKDGVIWAALDAGAEVPRVPAGMVPLRTVEIAAPHGEVEARLESGEGGMLWSGDLAVLVQAVGGETCRAHVLVREGADLRAASRDVERLRRVCEGG